MENIWIFIVAQLINVVLGTMRSVLTIRSSQNVAAIINAVSFTFYAGVVKMITGQEMWLVLVVTFITNIIGVYVAMWIVKKFSKDKIWKITITTEFEDVKDWICEGLEKYNLGYSSIEIESGYVIDAYSYTQNESLLIKEVISKHKVKYFVTEMNKTL